MTIITTHSGQQVDIEAPNSDALRIEDIAMPEPKAGEVLIRVHACGICGTDVHIFHGDEGAAKTPPRTVLG